MKVSGQESPRVPLPLMALNHVSYNCIDLCASIEFYTKVLGFKMVKRPSSFNFNGAWLFNYGFGIHLLESKCKDSVKPSKKEVNPRDNHISFQCSDMKALEETLKEMKIQYEKRIVEDDGIMVDQLFFHDPDGYMIEICNCENLPVIPVYKESETLKSVSSLSQSIASWKHICR